MSERQRTILSVAYPFAATGTHAVGGAEQVLATLESALVRRGFRSLVVAHPGSLVAGELIGVNVPDDLLTRDIRAEVECGMQAAINAVTGSGSVDLVHMHGIDFHRYVVPTEIPVLVTLHLPPVWYPPEIWDLPERYTLQCVSDSQKAACPGYVQERLVVVENGVPLYPPQQHTDAANLCFDQGAPSADFALLLSRICPEKNLHMAMDAARQAGMPVVLAGKVYPYAEHVDYFAHEIEPRLSTAARFVGPVEGEVKQRLLEQARCLLIPSIAEETSSLVAMEAIAAGTPVVAMRSGALPEIVEDGRTGFLVDDAAAMQSALCRLDRIDPDVCRQTARKRFSADAMVERYLRLYERLMR